MQMDRNKILNVIKNIALKCFSALCWLIAIIFAIYLFVSVYIKFLQDVYVYRYGNVYLK